MELRILLTGWMWGLRGKKQLRMAAKFLATVTDRTHNSETTHGKRKGWKVGKKRGGWKGGMEGRR